MGHRFGRGDIEESLSSYPVDPDTAAYARGPRVLLRGRAFRARVLGSSSRPDDTDMLPRAEEEMTSVIFEEAALMMKLPKRHATPGRGPACTNHNCHLARLGVTVVFVKPPQAAYSVHASL